MRVVNSSADSSVHVARRSERIARDRTTRMSATVHNEEEVRNTMKKYWSQHSEKGSIEEMMLDDQATEIESQVSLCSSSSPVGTHEPPTLSHIVPESAQDREEVLSLQPALKGKRVSSEGPRRVFCSSSNSRMSNSSLPVGARALYVLPSSTSTISTIMPLSVDLKMAD